LFSFLLGLLCLAIFPAEAATIHEQTGKDDGTGDQARFNSPHGIGFDAAGNLYVADLGHSSTRKITPGAVVTTFAAGSRRVGNDDGTGIEATFSEPNGLAVDTAGNI
jgi:DNA-binding beta-propeller fold protein YncE